MGPQSMGLTKGLTITEGGTFGYSVMFEGGFQFNMGGKFPGPCECSSRLFVISTTVLLRLETAEVTKRS